MRHWMAALTVAAGVAGAGPARADPPATVRLPDPGSRAAAAFRLRPLVVPSNPTFRIDDPRSSLRSGYGGSMVDLFPFAGGNFHFSGGPRLFGRAGRPRLIEPENLRLLPSFRGGPKLSRRLSPAMLVGYGHTVERGLTFGVDAGLVMGRVLQTPDRLGRLNRERADAESRGMRRGRDNEIARMTALYRF